MIKRLNQYLLTNYPVIWNLKVIPVALLVAVVQIFLFTVGYLMTEVDMKNDSSFYYRSAADTFYYIIYAGAVLTAILIFIFWLIQYNRNNGLKAHYPQSNPSLYLEWISIFLLCSFICFTPNSLSLGKAAKKKSVISEQECKETMSIIRRTEALLPSYTYSFNLGEKQKPLRVGNANVDRTKFDTRLFNYEEGALTPENPIEYIGPSYLYYMDNDVYSYNKKSIPEVEQVHRWLENQNRDSIEATLKAFLDLHKRHKLKTNVDLDYWMSLVYNPPLYPVDEDRTIQSNDYDVTNHITEKYVKYSNLESYYRSIENEYQDYEFKKWAILIAALMGLGFSMMVFSARFTSGRSWIFALLATGVIAFIFSIFTGIMALVDYGVVSSILYPLLWLILLVVIGFAIALKVVNGKQKGRSNIYINIVLWLIPTVIPIIYYLYYYLRYTLTGNYQYYTSIYEDTAYIMLVITIIFSVIIMFPIIMLLRKWKALPED